jgi:hypothetical protein
VAERLYATVGRQNWILGIHETNWPVLDERLHSYSRQGLVARESFSYVHPNSVDEVMEKCRGKLKDVERLRQKEIAEKVGRLLATRPDMIDYGPVTTLDLAAAEMVLASPSALAPTEVEELRRACSTLGVPLEVFQFPFVDALKIVLVRKYPGRGLKT